jgi:DNA-binding NtrC family response regulator
MSAAPPGPTSPRVTLPTARIAICDDEAAARRGVVRALGQEGYDFVECRDGRECLETLERPRQRPDLVLLDLRMPGMDGMTVLRHVVALPAPPPVVVVTADASLRSAIEAVKAGAADYLSKPYEIDELRLVVQRTLETARLRRENRWLAEEVRRLGGPRRLLGESAAIREVLDAIARVAPTSASVLLLGESGTGKELAARRIHELSERARGPFVTVNCAAIPDTLVESELFGHLRGAFTGADRDRPGKLRQADGGTLFLDEIGDMSPAAQAKLLRVLQEGVVEPLGGGRPVQVDVRVVAATHRDLKSMAAGGRFREDLLFRIRVVEIRLPALRERRGDVPLLADHFLAHSAAGGGGASAAAGAGRRQRPALSPAAQRLLLAYPWPGNVRELANAIERAVIFCRGGLVQPEDLPAELRGQQQDGAAARSLDDGAAARSLDDGAAARSLDDGAAARSPDVGAPAHTSGAGEARPLDTALPPDPAAGWSPGAGPDFSTAKARMLDSFERACFAAALRAHHGNLSRAAESLGMHRQSLQQKLHKLGISADPYRTR